MNKYVVKVKDGASDPCQVELLRFTVAILFCAHCPITNSNTVLTRAVYLTNPKAPIRQPHSYPNTLHFCSSVQRLQVCCREYIGHIYSCFGILKKVHLAPCGGPHLKKTPLVQNSGAATHTGKAPLTIRTFTIYLQRQDLSVRLFFRSNRRKVISALGRNIIDQKEFDSLYSRCKGHLPTLLPEHLLPFKKAS